MRWNTRCDHSFLVSIIGPNAARWAYEGGFEMPLLGSDRMQTAYDRYLAATPGSRARFAAAREHLAGGVNRGGMTFATYQLFIARAEGCYLCDLDARPF